MDKHLKASFVSAANHLTKLYTDSINCQKEVFIHGYSKGIHEVMEWISNNSDGKTVDVSLLLTWMKLQLQEGQNTLSCLQETATDCHSTRHSPVDCSSHADLIHSLDETSMFSAQAPRSSAIASAQKLDTEAPPFNSNVHVSSSNASSNSKKRQRLILQSTCGGNRASNGNIHSSFSNTMMPVVSSEMDVSYPCFGDQQQQKRKAFQLDSV